VPPESLSFEVKVTDRCNQQCFHCMNDDTRLAGRDLDGDLFVRRLTEWGVERERSALDITEVRMTGGEPLLVLPTVTAISRACTALGIRSGINTNGALLDRSTLALLKASGLSVVKVSLDSLDEEVLRGMRDSSVAVARIAEAVERALALGCKVLVRFTLSARNRDQLVPCYQAARGWGVSKFQVKPLVPAGRAIASGAFLSVPETERAIRELAAAVAGETAAPEILCWPPELAAGLPARACGNTTKMYVNASAAVLHCNFLQGAPYADLHDASLEEVRLRRRPELRTTGRYAVLAGCPAWRQHEARLSV
jgi:MoaA/NifB/PqqE/SkfB family radical SAM enzyme